MEIIFTPVNGLLPTWNTSSNTPPCKKVDFITTVSDPLKDNLTSLFGNKVATIENGFDNEDSG